MSLSAQNNDESCRCMDSNDMMSPHYVKNRCLSLIILQYRLVRLENPIWIVVSTMRHRTQTLPS